MSTSANPYAVEFLERRTLLSGNVNAEMDGSTLVITGDSERNRIEIERDSEDPRTTIQVDGDDTSVNNSGETETFTGVESIIVRMKGGGDLVTIDNDMNLIGDLRIFMGKGNDDVEVSDQEPDLGEPDFIEVRIHGDLEIRGQTGNDDIDVDDTRVFGETLLLGQSGNDNFDIEDNIFEGDFELRAARGFDTISIPASRFEAGKIVRGGPDNDEINDET